MLIFRKCNCVTIKFKSLIKMQTIICNCISNTITNLINNY